MVSGQTPYVMVFSTCPNVHSMHCFHASVGRCHNVQQGPLCASMTAILGTCSSLRILGITRSSIHFASKVFSLYSVTTLFWILRQLSRNLQFQTGPTFLSRRHSTKKKLSRRRRSCDAPPTHTFTIQEAEEEKNLLRKCRISEDAISEFFSGDQNDFTILKIQKLFVQTNVRNIPNYSFLAKKT